MTSYTVNTKYVRVESFYGRQADVNVPKTGLKSEKNEKWHEEWTINQEGSSQSNAKSLLLLVCVIPLIPLFQWIDESFWNHDTSFMFICQYNDASIFIMQQFKSNLRLHPSWICWSELDLYGAYDNYVWWKIFYWLYWESGWSLYSWLWVLVEMIESWSLLS